MTAPFRMIKWRVAMTLTAILTITACASMTTFVGKTAQQDEQVALLNGGPHEGIWETVDVVIDYTYVNQPDALEIKGSVRLARSLTTGFTSVERFRVRINFLDTDKTVLDSQLVYVSGFRVPIRTWGFEHRFDLPETATGFNFSYTGTVNDFSGSGGVGSRGGDGVSWRFWKNP